MNISAVDHFRFAPRVNKYFFFSLIIVSLGEKCPFECMSFAARINSTLVEITLLVFVTFYVVNNFIDQESKSETCIQVCLESEKQECHRMN
jgi:hypothetical protein